MTDIAARLSASNELFRILVDSVRDYAIFALDVNGNVVTWNAGAESINGYRAEEIIGHHWSQFYPPEAIASGNPEWELREATARGSMEEEGWRVRKDGSRFWANVVVTTLHDENGALLGFANVTRDLTLQRLADEELRQSEARSRLIIQSVKDYGIFMLDVDGRVLSWNEGAHRIMGYTVGEIVGQHFSAFYPAEDLAWGKPKWELEVASDEGRLEDEGWRLRKDGTRFWANVVITALRDSTGTLVGFAKVTRDLTERRAAQERSLADARRIAEVEAANRAKSEFLTAMSHELRTPLNAIGGYADLLAMGAAGAVSPQQEQYLDRIRASQQHLLGIINDLLNLGRIEAGQLAYDLAPVSLSEVIDAMVPLIEPQARAKGVVVRRVACVRDVVACADRQKVEQILLNLLSNAVKFTKPGGHVQVSCDRTGDRCTLAVEDDGIGVPADKLAAIFDAFVQVGRSLTSQHEGTGLGLAISRELARAMGGDVTVRSTVGQGSTFMLNLPGVQAGGGGQEKRSRRKITT